MENNQATIRGFVGQDAEMGEKGNYVKFTVATKEFWKDKQTSEPRETTAWHNIIVWREEQLEIARQLKAGDFVDLQGRIDYQRWTDKNGIDRLTSQVVLSGKEDSLTKVNYNKDTEIPRSQNTLTLKGRLTADPEIRTGENGGKEFATFGVATNATYRDAETKELKETPAIFHNVTAFSSEAVANAKAMKKGDLVVLQGQMETQTWKDEQGNTKYAPKVMVKGYGSYLSTPEQQKAAAIELVLRDNERLKGTVTGFETRNGVQVAIVENYNTFAIPVTEKQQAALKVGEKIEIKGVLQNNKELAWKIDTGKGVAM